MFTMVIYVILGIINAVIVALATEGHIKLNGIEYPSPPTTSKTSLEV